MQHSNCNTGCQAIILTLIIILEASNNKEENFIVISEINKSALFTAGFSSDNQIRIKQGGGFSHKLLLAFAFL